MIRQISRPVKIALCRECGGRGSVEGDEPGERVRCLQCEGSGRVCVSCEMTLEIHPYKPKRTTAR